MPGLFDRLQSEIDRRETVDALSPMDLLALEPELRAIVQALMRRGDATAEEIGAACGMPADEASALLEALVEKGMAARTIGDADAPRWRANLGRRRGRTVPAGIWARLAASTAAGEAEDRAEPGGRDDEPAPGRDDDA